MCVYVYTYLHFCVYVPMYKIIVLLLFVDMILIPAAPLQLLWCLPKHVFLSHLFFLLYDFSKPF